MVADRVDSLSPERVKLILIALNGIMRKLACFGLIHFSKSSPELCQEDGKRKSRLCKMIRDLRTANAELQAGNETLIGNASSAIRCWLTNAG
jgi:hypothetical protein